MSINLNDESYSAKQGAAIFNGGNAGLVDNVSISVEKKKADDKNTAPDYKLVFTDASGASCNNSFWYITEDTKFSTVDEQVMKMGKICKHLLHAIYGADFEIPAFADAKAMLDGTMKLVREGLPNAGKFRIFANYGTKQYCKSFIQPRSWVPFMESMNVAIEDTRLKASDLDAMVRLEQDGKPNGAAASTASDDDDWD